MELKVTENRERLGQERWREVEYKRGRVREENLTKD